jgi:thymidylate synthase ThyX
MLSTKDIKVKFLGITPVLEDETGVLDPQTLVALSGLLTYSGKPIGAILKEIQDKGQSVEKKITAILRKSSLKGHASMATTPVFSFSYEASKFIDSGLTGMVFASAIMASGRRTDTTPEDIVFPEAISQASEAAAVYRTVSERNIEVFNHLLAGGVGKDEASKILQYGIYGTGIIQFPVESLVSLKRQYEAEKEWMPEDIGFLIAAVEKELKRLGVDLLYATRLAAPRNNYPYPNIFKDPEQTNLPREMGQANKASENFKIISSDFVITAGLEKRLRELEAAIKEAANDRQNLKDKWMRLLQMRQQIAGDYMQAANVKIFSSAAWRVWGDKKRHRTVPMAVDSVYYFVRRALAVLLGYKKQIQEKSLPHAAIDAIDNVFSVPPGICNDNEFLYQYLGSALDSLEGYAKLLELGIKERDAIFAVPRGLKLDMVQDYNFYNLIAGYYPLRICSTAEEELRRLSIKEVTAIKNLLQQKGLDWLAWHIQPKCHCAGFCLEENCCGMIKSLVKDYNDEFHKEIHKDLENKFRVILNSVDQNDQE